MFLLHILLHIPLTSVLNSMTLGHVYDLDLKKNETLIKEVIIQAQGEVSRFLRSLRLLAQSVQDGFGRVHQASERDVDELYP